ncbi:terminase large subunit domain-containing protein [Enterovirga sp. CN4-39]|uniref:terminase large subunit domain-containing protein n=1 Tax=Enterovirga sp. CN4-39 TaxID=3400910 RepID=UPI003C005FE2
MLIRSLLAALASRAAKQHQGARQAAKGVEVIPIERQGRLPREAAIDRAIGEPDELDAFLALPITEQLSRIEKELASLPPNEQRLILDVLKTEMQKPWLSLPGPQTQALLSLADILLYGGSAGGGKTALEVGCAITEHSRSLILRRQSTELDGIIAESREIIKGNGSFNSSPGAREWTLPGGKSLKFGGCKEPDDWRDYAGRARDFMGFDEAAEFLEEQVASLIAWNRSTDPKQRSRVILASNPPRGAEGEWIIRWFAPWLEPGHPNPAKPGELRWAVYVDPDTVWIDEPEFDEDGKPKPVIINGEEYTPRSRTFIPARLEDNPFLERTGYRASLQSLPEPLRSQLLKGDFLAGRKDDDWQVIPTAWIEAAQARWTPQPPPGREMTSLAADSAEGGADEFVLQPRYGNWFPHPTTRRGVDTADSALMAGIIVGTMKHGCEIVIDLGGGWGGKVYGHLKENVELHVTAYMGVAPSQARTQDGKLGFLNVRAQDIWKLREALDPQSGQAIALPPDPKMASDLASFRWKLRPGGIIQIEDKATLKKRLGRSPDRGEGVVMAWAHGGLRAMERAETHRQAAVANLGYAHAKQDHRKSRGPMAQPKVNLGYAHGRRR